MRTTFFLLALGLATAPAFAAPLPETTPAGRLAKVEASLPVQDARALVFHVTNFATDEEREILWSDVADVRRVILANASRLFVRTHTGRFFWVTRISRMDAGGREVGVVDAARVSEVLTHPASVLPSVIGKANPGARERAGLIAWLEAHFKGRPDALDVRRPMVPAPVVATPPAPARTARSAEAERRLAALGAGVEVRFVGPVAAGGRLPPGPIPPDEILDLHTEAGLWNATIWTGGEARPHVFKKLHQDGHLVADDPRLRLTDAERAAVPEEVSRRMARLQTLRQKFVSTPTEGDIRGPLAGTPGDAATVFHTVSSVDITDILHMPDQGWFVTVGKDTHHFLDRDPRGGEGFSIGSLRPLASAPAPRRGIRGIR